MARDTLAINQIGPEGSQFTPDITETAMVTANGLQFVNEGKTELEISNDGVSGVQTATIGRPQCPTCGDPATMSVVVAQGKKVTVGPFRKDVFNQADGNVYIDSATEDVFKFAAVRRSNI